MSPHMTSTPWRFRSQAQQVCIPGTQASQLAARLADAEERGDPAATALRGPGMGFGFQGALGH